MDNWLLVNTCDDDAGMVWMVGEYEVKFRIVVLTGKWIPFFQPIMRENQALVVSTTVNLFLWIRIER